MRKFHRVLVRNVALGDLDLWSQYLCILHPQSSQRHPSQLPWSCAHPPLPFCELEYIMYMPWPLLSAQVSCRRTSDPSLPPWHIRSLPRQHGVDPDSPRRLVAAGPDCLLLAHLHLRRWAAGPDQHQHADHPGVQLRPRGQRHVVQRRGLQPARQPQQRGPHRHPGLYLRPVGWVMIWCCDGVQKRASDLLSAAM